jgi:hypothetical protein
VHCHSSLCLRGPSKAYKARINAPNKTRRRSTAKKSTFVQHWDGRRTESEWERNGWVFGRFIGRDSEEAWWRELAKPCVLNGNQNLCWWGVIGPLAKATLRLLGCYPLMMGESNDHRSLPGQGAPAEWVNVPAGLFEALSTTLPTCVEVMGISHPSNQATPTTQATLGHSWIEC